MRILGRNGPILRIGTALKQECKRFSGPISLMFIFSQVSLFVQVASQIGDCDTRLEIETQERVGQ